METDAVVERFCSVWDKPVSSVQLACCQSYYAVSWKNKNVLTYSTTTFEEPLSLTGHYNNVTALEFGAERAPILLCSASDDYVIIWDVERCFKQMREGMIASGMVIGRLLGKVVHLSLCNQNERVAVCSGSRVLVLNAKREEMLAELGGHLGTVTASGFCPWDLSQLVSISEDRTFKIWDVKKEQILFQSSVLSGYPLLSLFFMNESKKLIVGSSDGQVWCYTLPGDHKCCLVTKQDLHRLVQRHEKKVDSSDQLHSRTAGFSSDDQRGEVEIVKPVLRIWDYPPKRSSHSIQQRDDEVWMGSSDGFYLLDLAISELRLIISFKDNPRLSISLARSWATSKGSNNNMYCLVSSHFEAKVALIDVDVAKIDSLCCEGKAFAENLSVFPSSSPVPSSPLNAELKKRDPKPLKITGVKNHALVFHTVVKSSGYTASPHRMMFTPKTNMKKKSMTSTESAKNAKTFLSDYPSCSAAPSSLHTHLTVSTMPTSINCLKYSGDGKRIVCGLGDGSVLLYKSSLTGNPAVYTGHNKPVSSVGWSHSRQLFMSASEDRTLSVWSTEVTQPVLTMESEEHAKANRWAQFYYLDRFVLLGSGSNLLLYLYHLDKSKNDIKRYEQKSMFRLSSKFSMYSGTEITAVSAINDFFSYIVLTAGADRSIQVFDMNCGCLATTICDAHYRAVHHLTQNKGSMYSTQDLDSYNLFISSAVTDGIRLWDLRTARCVRHYQSHLNRCQRCTAVISPCGRYVATGSEDNCAYVYDIRSSSFLHKLQWQSDTVLNVDFNPSTPELLTATMDGKLAMFHPEDGVPFSQV